MVKNDEYWKYHSTPNCKCVICGKEIYIRPNRLKSIKHGVTCSIECGSKNRSKWFRGTENHQFGLKEELNPTFKSWKHKNSNGYIDVHKKDHPFCNTDGFVKEHRLVVEENADLFDSKYFVEIEGKKYLKPEVEVHHKNEIKDDNRIENLLPLTKVEHISLHNKQKEMIRDKSNGRIITFVKKDISKRSYK